MLAPRPSLVHFLVPLAKSSSKPSAAIRTVVACATWPSYYSGQLWVASSTSSFNYGFERWTVGRRASSQHACCSRRLRTSRALGSTRRDPWTQARCTKHGGSTGRCSRDWTVATGRRLTTQFFAWLIPSSSFRSLRVAHLGIGWNSRPSCSSRTPVPCDAPVSWCPRNADTSARAVSGGAASVDDDAACGSYRRPGHSGTTHRAWALCEGTADPLG